MKLITKQKVKGEDVPVTTSRKVAEYFGKEHKNVVRDIENLLVGGGLKSELSSMYIISSYKSKQNKPLKQYLLTQDGFTLLAMGFTGTKALEFKLAYINAFNEMRIELENFRVNREIAREGYKGLTCVLRLEKGTDVKPYHFSNEANMINKIVLGLTAKQYCDVFEHPRNKMRDFLSAEELEAISRLEKYDEILIEKGLSFEERQEELNDYHIRFLRRTLKVA